MVAQTSQLGLPSFQEACSFPKETTPPHPFHPDSYRFFCITQPRSLTFLPSYTPFLDLGPHLLISARGICPKKGSLALAPVKETSARVIFPLFLQGSLGCFKHSLACPHFQSFSYLLLAQTTLASPKSALLFGLLAGALRRVLCLTTQACSQPSGAPVNKKARTRDRKTVLRQKKCSKSSNLGLTEICYSKVTYVLQEHLLKQVGSAFLRSKTGPLSVHVCT